MNLFWLSCLLVSTVLVNGYKRPQDSVEYELSQYLLTVPQILSPTSNQVCLTSFNGYIPKRHFFRISLLNPRTNGPIEVLETEISSDKQCYNIETKNVETKYVKMEVLLKSEDSEEPLVEFKKMIRFMPSNGMTMIETSKPIYQPGEILNFRAIGIDGWMKPWDESFTSVSVYNAEGTKVMEWQGEQLENGLKHYELPIAQFNKEGTWRIHAITKHGEHVDKLFQVNRNVESEAVLKIKQGGEFILANEDVHRMVVCAEDKEGIHFENGLVSVKTIHGHYIVKDLPLEESCVHFSLKNVTLQWSNKVGKAIQGSIEFRRQEDQAPLAFLPIHLPVVRSQVHLRVPSSALVKNYFKLGLPYFGYFFVERPDYTPLPNAEVEICYQTTSKPWQFEEGDEKICKTFVSSPEGAIKFVIPPVERTTKQIMIEATIPGVADHRQNFVVHPWDSQNQDQFIVEPIVRVRSCKRSMPEATKYTLLMTRNGTQAFDKLYLQPAGRVSSAPTKSIKLSPAPWTPEADLLIGEWPENTEVFYANVYEDISSPNSYTPMNRVVFFGYDSRGNLISDSIAYLKDCLQDESLMEVALDEENQLNVDLKASEKVPCSITVGTSSQRGRLTEQKINKMLERFDDTFTKTFEWDKCSLELQHRSNKSPLMIDFKNNWDTFKEMGLHAAHTQSEIFNKTCEWNVFDEGSRNRSHQALAAIRSYLPYPENVMNSLAYSADMAHLSRLENTLANDLIFWGSRAELNEWLEKFNPSTLADKSSISVHAICLDPVKGIRSQTIEKSLKTAPVFLEHDLPKKMSDKAVRYVSIFVKRHESSIKESNCVPVELEVDADSDFDIESELPKICACSKSTKVNLKVKPLKKGPINLKVKAKFAKSLNEECDSVIDNFETQQIVLKTNVESIEPKVTRRSYEIACKDVKKNLKAFKNEEKTHATRDLINVFLKQCRDDEPIRRNIYEVLNKFNGLMNMYEQNEREIPSTLLPNLRKTLVTLYQELALFRMADGSYSVYAGSQRTTSLVATTLAYRAITQAQSKFPIFGGASMINPTFDVIVQLMMKDGCFRPKQATHVLGAWPFSHNVSSLELTAFVASTMAEVKQTPKVVLRKAIKCIDQLKETEEMDSLTKTMVALLYARVNRIEEAQKLIENFDLSAQNENLRRSNKVETRSIPDRFLKLNSNEQIDEEIVRARAFFVLAKLAMNETENLEQQVQQLVSSDLSLHDPLITFAVTRAWSKIAAQQRTLAISLNNNKMDLEQFEMKKVDLPKKASNLMLEILAPGCALLERVEEIDVHNYNLTFPVIAAETREAEWSTPEGENVPAFTKRGFKIIKSQRIGESCDSRKITICPKQEHSNQRTIVYKVALPVNYRINTVALDQMIALQKTPVEMYRTMGQYNILSIGRYFEQCVDIPMVKTGEMIDEDEQAIASVFALEQDFNRQPLVGTIPIEKECSTRTRREASPSNQSNQKHSKKDEYSQYPQETQQTYEAPVKGYPSPPAPTYAPAPAYDAPAYEAPVKGYAPPPAPAYAPPPPPTYAPAPAYDTQYPAPAYEGYDTAYVPPPPAYAPAPAYDAQYPAPAYEAPVKGYAPPPAPAYAPPAYAPPPPPAYAPAPAYDTQYPAPAYEAPVKGYAPPPAPAYAPPAYAPPPPPAYAPAPAYDTQYPAPAYEAPVKGYAPPPPPAYAPPTYAPPAYAPPPAYEQAYQAPVYEAPVKGYAPPPPPPVYAPAPAYAPPPPPAYAPAPAYEAQYPAPAYEAPVKGYAPPPAPAYAPPPPPAYAPPAYAPPAYAAPPPPAYAPAPAYDTQYPAPAYEAPVKGYAPPPPPAYAPAPAPAYQGYEPAKGYPQAPNYRNARAQQGREARLRYETNILPLMKRYKAQKRAQYAASVAPKQVIQAHHPSLYKSASEIHEQRINITRDQLVCPKWSGSCPECKNLIEIHMIDRICNSSMHIASLDWYDSQNPTCGTFDDVSTMEEELPGREGFSAWSLPENCRCSVFDNGRLALIISNKYQDELAKLDAPEIDGQPSPRTRLDGDYLILRGSTDTLSEIKAYKEMCKTLDRHMQL